MTIDAGVAPTGRADAAPADTAPTDAERMRRQVLRSAGLRATPGRLAVLERLAAHPHSSVAELVAALAGRLPTLSPQSVHNIVNDFTQAGVARRVELPGSASARYETRTGDNHHHIQCVVCGRLEDVDCVIGEAPCLAPDDAHGMRVLEAEIVFRGVCRGCETPLAARASRDAQTDFGADQGAVPTTTERNPAK